SKVPPGVWSGALGLISRERSPFVGTRIQKGLRIAHAASSGDDIYLSFLDEWSHEENPAMAGGDPCRFDMDLGIEAPEAIRMMYCDAVSYLPDDILCKVDRASMAVSLETRVPFLDHRVASMAARIPLELKIRGG